jgi:hypothetical protein
MWRIWSKLFFVTGDFAQSVPVSESDDHLHGSSARLVTASGVRVKVTEGWLDSHSLSEIVSHLQLGVG